MPTLVPFDARFAKPDKDVVLWKVRRLPRGGYEGMVKIPMALLQVFSDARGNTIVSASRNGQPRAVPAGTVQRVHRPGDPLAVKAAADTPEDALAKAANVARGILDPSTPAGAILNEALPPGAGIALSAIKSAATSDAAKKVYGAIKSIF
jgi:hypothetical protein